MNLEMTVSAFAEIAESKAIHLRSDFPAFLILAAKAGAYVGFGVLLIFSVGQGIDVSIRPIVMGISFGLALMLVVFAGSELFTGHTMYMTHGLLTGRTGIFDLVFCWSASWFGNLIGAVFFAALFLYSGSELNLGDHTTNLLYLTAEKKIQGSWPTLILKGVLCNWLVCLAIWMAARVTSDVAKIVLIWFCLYAFIALGFEHSVANMAIFSIVLLSEHGAGITLTGVSYNIFFVTIGNVIAGAGFMGIGYWIVAGRPRVTRQSFDKEISIIS